MAHAVQFCLFRTDFFWNMNMEHIESCLCSQLLHTNTHGACVTVKFLCWQYENDVKKNKLTKHIFVVVVVVVDKTQK